MNKKQKKFNKKRNYRNWIAYFEELYKAERQKVEGYEQLAKLHSAYISILLNKLGATKDKPCTITGDEIKEALEKYETKALLDGDNSCKFYCESIE